MVSSLASCPSSGPPAPEASALDWAGDPPPSFPAWRLAGGRTSLASGPVLGARVPWSPRGSCPRCQDTLVVVSAPSLRTVPCPVGLLDIRPLAAWPGTCAVFVVLPRGFLSVSCATCFLPGCAEARDFVFNFQTPSSLFLS